MGTSKTNDWERQFKATVDTFEANKICKDLPFSFPEALWNHLVLRHRLTHPLGLYSFEWHQTKSMPPPGVVSIRSTRQQLISIIATREKMTTQKNRQPRQMLPIEESKKRDGDSSLRRNFLNFQRMELYSIGSVQISSRSLGRIVVGWKKRPMLSLVYSIESLLLFVIDWHQISFWAVALSRFQILERQQKVRMLFCRQFFWFSKYWWVSGQRSILPFPVGWRETQKKKEIPARSWCEWSTRAGLTLESRWNKDQKPSVCIGNQNAIPNYYSRS